MKIDLEDMNYTIEYQIKNSYADFKVYVHYKIDGEIKYEDKNIGGSPNPIDDLKEAEQYFRGSIRFDECSDWEFHPEHEMLVHFCGLEDAKNLYLLMEKMYKICEDEGIIY